MRITSLLAALSLSLAAACAGADTPSDTTPPPAEEPAAAEPTSDEQPAAPPAEGQAAGAPTDPTPAAAITVAVQNLAKGQSGPSKKPLAVTATSGTNQITLHLENFTHYCSPEPSFSAAALGEKLVVTVAKPASAVSRCVAPFALDAVVSLPGRSNVRSVSVVGDGGKELGTATVTAGK